LPIIFVGAEEGLPPAGSPGSERVSSVVIQATGRGNLEFNYGRLNINLVPATGPRVVAAVLDFLNTRDYFESF
jgi:hypothetical protein